LPNVGQYRSHTGFAAFSDYRKIAILLTGTVRIFTGVWRVCGISTGDLAFSA